MTIVPTRRARAQAVVATLCVCGGVAANAHHSRAAFDTAVEVTIEGEVANVQWANPHVYLDLRVTTLDGALALQQVEVGPLSTLGPLGLRREVLVPGERVTVRANPNRKGAGYTVVGLDVTLADGEIYPLHVFGRSQPAPVSQRASTLAGKWVPATEGWRELVYGSRDWPVTGAGRRALADTESQLRSQAECAPWAVPVFMTFPALIEIELEADAVEMRFDWMNGARTIHLNEASRPSMLSPSLQGYSTGHWEGATLVVETSGFAPHREGVGFGIPSSERKRLTERITLAEDGKSALYEFTVDDPLSLTAPVTRRTTWTYRPDLEPSGQPCDAEVATRFLRD